MTVHSLRVGALALLFALAAAWPCPALAQEADKPKWIAEQIELVKTGDVDLRRKALEGLVEKDAEGDCFTPLIALLAATEDEAVQLDLIRTLGRDGLTAAAEPIAALVSAKSDDVRSNAAVSLEYIGDPVAAKPLLKQLGKEKVEAIQNNLARAAGRCGSKDDSVRSKLLKLAAGGKSETQGLGAIIGLAYFEGDAKAARGVEKLLAKIGPPSFGRRGGAGKGTLRRTYLTWALAEIGDRKSPPFIEDRLMKPLKNTQSPFLQPLLDFYADAMDACDGDKDAMGRVEGGVQFVQRGEAARKFQDDAREGRDQSKFKPKGEWTAPADDGAGPGRRPPR